MIEILLILVLVVLAKKRGRGKFRRYLRGNVRHRVVATTLAAQTLVGTDVADSVTERCWMSSVVLRWSLEKMTAGQDIGPLMVGVAHSDYTDAEIEAWVENQASWEEADQIGQEVGRRKIRKVGIFQTPQAVEDAVVLNNGKPIRTKCGWILTTGQTLRVWVYNMGQAAVATTAPNIFAEGHANLWPR